MSAAERHAIRASDGAPPVGPYSPALAVGNLVFVSGQIALDADGALTGATAAEQTRTALMNLRATLAAAGLDLADVAKTTIFLSDMGDFAAVNEVYAEFFAEPYPARSTVEVARLPKNALVEIEALAVR